MKAPMYLHCDRLLTKRYIFMKGLDKDMKKSKMGILIVASIICMLFTLSACSESGEDSFSERSYEHINYVSSIEKDDCYLCGDRTDHELSTYWGQDSLGLINVNTFEVFEIPINHYSDSGVLLEVPTGVLQTGIGTVGESQVHAFTDTDYGWSDVDIIPNGDGVDPDAIGQYLCEDCLDEFASHYFEHDAPIEIALINFAIRELRPLEESSTMFFLGNYLVDCVFQENGVVDLLVVYRPLRYQDR